MFNRLKAIKHFYETVHALIYSTSQLINLKLESNPWWINKSMQTRLIKKFNGDKDCWKKPWNKKGS